jgi:hypothetical protein
MGKNVAETSTLSRLIPDLTVEVRRNLVVWLAVAIGGAAVFSALFALAVDPGLSEITGGVAVVMFALFLTILALFALLLLTQVYLFGCWPVLLRSRFLCEQFGMAPDSLSWQARRREMWASGYWAAFGRGAVVGLAFVSAVILAWWGVTGKWTFSIPSAVLVLVAGQIAGEAWVVRQVVTRHTAAAPSPNET